MLSLARGKEGSFKLVSGYKPEGDQPAAIESIVKNLNDKLPHQVLLGVTGSGKTFTMANVIARVNRPTLVMAPNKTLAAQLYNEFKSLFPENAVRYFVSYYDYYQPEAYLPSTDTFIEKDASINDEIDKLRHSATKALLERNDVLIVASVSCIYGLGEPEVYFEMVVFLEEGQTIDRDKMLRKLVDLALSAQRLRFSSRDVPRARRHGRDFPGVRRAARGAGRILRRPDRNDVRNRRAARQGDPQAAERRDLPGVALRDDLRSDGSRGAQYPHRIEGAARVLPHREPPARSPASRTAHDVRPRAAGRDGLLSRHRKLFASSDRPPARTGAADAARLLPEQFAVLHRREPRDGAANRRDVSRRSLAQIGAGRFRLPAAVGARQPPA